METKETILEQFEKSTEQENDVKQEQVEQVSQDVEEHAPEIVVHETSAESSYEEAEDKEPVEVKEEEETAEQVEEHKEEEVEEPDESQEPKEEVEKSTKDSKEDDVDEEEDSKDSEKDKDDEEDDDKDKDKDKDDKSKKSESDMFEAIKSIIDSSMGQINERIAKLEDTVTKGLVTETVESEPVEQEVEPVEEVTEVEPEAVIEAEDVEEPKEEEPAEVKEEVVEVEEEPTAKSVKVATQNRENNDEQAIKSVIQDDEDAVGYASKDASHIQETLEEEPKEEETAKSFDGVAQTVEAKENPQEFMIKHRQAFLDELSKAYKSSGYSNGYREDLRRAFLDINNGSHNKQQFELVKSFLNK